MAEHIATLKRRTGRVAATSVLALLALAPHAEAALTVTVPNMGIAPGDADRPFDVTLTPSGAETLLGFTLIVEIVPSAGATGTLTFAGPPGAPAANYVFDASSRGFAGVLNSPTQAAAYDVSTTGPVSVTAEVNVATFFLDASNDFAGAWSLVISTDVLALDGRSEAGDVVEVGVVLEPSLLDVDDDGGSDSDDYLEIVDCYRGQGEYRPFGCERADLDGDNDVDCGDVAIFRSFVDVGACRFGDFDCDGDTDLRDHEVLVVAMHGPLEASQCAAFDDDGNGALDLSDYAAFQRAFVPLRPPNKF